MPDAQPLLLSVDASCQLACPSASVDLLLTPAAAAAAAAGDFPLLSAPVTGLFAVCTFLNVAAFLFWVVFIFEIIQAEVDALRAQQEVCSMASARRGGSFAWCH
jgi:hypothetical protein